MYVPSTSDRVDEQLPAGPDIVGREMVRAREGSDPQLRLLGEPRQPAEPAAVTKTLLTILGLLDAAGAAVRARRVGGDPLFALGLNLAAGRTANLMPASYTEGPTDNELDDAVAAVVEQLARSGDPLLLLRTAEELTRVHETEDYPPGTTVLVVRLIDLIRDWTP